MSEVEFQGISKSYGSVTALSGVNLGIGSGEFVTLLGPSGSGKTTLLNIVSGMIAPSSGSILIGGQDMTGLPARDRGLGMVFQNYALMPHMTVLENVAFPLRIRKLGRKEIDKRVMEVLDVVQLPHLADRKPRELSGGQQQRVAIARCLVYEPTLILMDEPLGALDKKLREQLQLEIKKIHKNLKVTILYVTHDQDEALVLSDRICVMSEGRIEQIGTSHELYFRPRTEFVADFLGESNLLEGRIVSVEENVVTLETGAGDRIRAPARGDLTPGTAARIMVRPESVRVGPQPLSDRNCIRGAVVDQIFAGESSRYFIRCSANPAFIAKQYNHAASSLIANGTEIYVTWDPADTCVIQ